MIVRIEVTVEDIVDGAPESECNCAVAIAVRRALPGRTVEVYTEVVYVDGAEVTLPPEAVKFIETFDEYRKPDPIAFDLDVPEAAP